MDPFGCGHKTPVGRSGSKFVAARSGRSNPTVLLSHLHRRLMSIRARINRDESGLKTAIAVCCCFLTDEAGESERKGGTFSSSR